MKSLENSSPFPRCGQLSGVWDSIETMSSYRFFDFLLVVYNRLFKELTITEQHRPVGYPGCVRGQRLTETKCTGF